MPETATDRALLGFYGQPGGQYQGIRLGEDYRNLVLDELLRSIGSLQSQSLNRISPDLPEATKISLQRGIAQGGAEAIQRGVTGAERDIALSNRDALLRILGLKQGEELAKIYKGGNRDFLGNLLSSVGAGAGFLLGGPGGAGAGYAAGSALGGG